VNFKTRLNSKNKKWSIFFGCLYGAFLFLGIFGENKTIIFIDITVEDMYTQLNTT